MIDRRRFLIGACAVAAAANWTAGEEQKLRAAIIGHTGRGGYGHGMDAVFTGRAGIDLVAIADADEAGLAAAVKRCGAQHGYADFREMIEKEKPALVSIAPRTTAQRREMLLAAVGAGAHVICEKPFVRTPADADQVLALAEKNKVKIAVMHQMRLAPAVVHLKKKIEGGLIGDLLEIRTWGKQDQRAGGEDLLVLGVHLFDLMRLFAGQPKWCSAQVLQDGHDAKAEDWRLAGEEIGPILGDEIEAQFSFDKNVWATFTSRAKLRDTLGHWGMELIGSKGRARIFADIWPSVLVNLNDKTGQAWKPLEDDPSLKATPADRETGPADARVVDDWLAAIKENRDPACSGKNAAKAVEMVMAVWRAGISRNRVEFPLKERGHPLQPSAE
jgi:predicted dehydrogenase